MALNEFRVWRAKVVAVEDAGNGHKKIMVQDTSAVGDTGVIEAVTCTPIPVTDQGSTYFAYPDVASECLCASQTDGHESVTYILSYTPRALTSTNNFGTMAPEPVKPGGFFLKIGGGLKSVFSMARGGIIRLFSGEFARLSIDGSAKEIVSSSKSASKYVAGGYTKDEFHPTHLRTQVDNLTHHSETYCQTQELSDVEISENTEGISALVPMGAYNGRAIVKGGSLYNPKLVTSLFPQHPYQIETRQSTGDNLLFKDTTATIRLGHQAGRNIGSYKHSTSQFHPAGTLYEIEAKRNTHSTPGIGTTSSMLWRYGRYEGDISTRDTALPSNSAPGIPDEPTTGEIFRHQMYDEITPNISNSLGFDPVGEGLGYEWPDSGIENASAKQQYLESFGELNSLLLATDFQLSKSYWRFHTHNYSIPGAGTKTGLSYERFLGGGNQTIGDITYFSELYMDYNTGAQMYSYAHDCGVFGGDQKYTKVITTPTHEQEFSLKVPTASAGGEILLSSKDTAALSTRKLELKDDYGKLEVMSGTVTYDITYGTGSVKISLADTTAPTTSPYVELTTAGIVLHPGTTGAVGSVYLGGSEPASGQQLVTKSYIDLLFKNHMHLTTSPGAPTSPPTAEPATAGLIASLEGLAEAGLANPAKIYTYQTKGE